MTFDQQDVPEVGRRVLHRTRDILEGRLDVDVFEVQTMGPDGMGSVAVMVLSPQAAARVGRALLDGKLGPFKAAP